MRATALLLRPPGPAAGVRGEGPSLPPLSRTARLARGESSKLGRVPSLLLPPPWLVRGERSVDLEGPPCASCDVPHANSAAGASRAWAALEAGGGCRAGSAAAGVGTCNAGGSWGSLAAAALASAPRAGCGAAQLFGAAAPSSWPKELPTPLAAAGVEQLPLVARAPEPAAAVQGAVRHHVLNLNPQATCVRTHRERAARSALPAHPTLRLQDVQLWL